MPLTKRTSDPGGRVKVRKPAAGRFRGLQHDNARGHLDLHWQTLDKGLDLLTEQLAQSRKEMAQMTQAITAQHTQSIARYADALSQINNNQQPAAQYQPPEVALNISL